MIPEDDSCSYSVAKEHFRPKAVIEHFLPVPSHYKAYSGKKCRKKIALG